MAYTYKGMVVLFCALIIALACMGRQRRSGEPGQNCCTSKYSTQCWDTLDIKKLSAEYARLKHAKCEGCNVFMSDYRHIMEALGNKLNGRHAKQIISIMGKPDCVKQGQYIYFWRGWHDYLYFMFTADSACAGWYYAYE